MTFFQIYQRVFALLRPERKAVVLLVVGAALAVRASARGADPAERLVGDRAPLFDSGFGGLTVARAVIDLLPHEDVVYVGDTGRYPYGPRPLDEVAGFAEQITHHLVHDLAAEVARVGDGVVLTVVVDDVETLRDTPLEQALMAHRDRLAFVVALSPDAAGKTFSGPYGEVRKTQEGLVLSPTSALVGTQLFGQKIPKFMVGRAGAGGGALHSGGRWAQVQVPDVTR